MASKLETAPPRSVAAAGSAHLLVNPSKNTDLDFDTSTAAQQTLGKPISSAVAKNARTSDDGSCCGKPTRVNKLRVTVESAAGTKGRNTADPTNLDQEFVRCTANDDAATHTQILQPKFDYVVPVERLHERLSKDPMDEIRDGYVDSALNVLRLALQSVDSATDYEHWVYGQPVDQAEVQEHITSFVCQHRLHDKVWVRFSQNKISCVGAVQRSMKNSQDVVEPGCRQRRHVFWVSTAKALRRHELRMFVAHEVGTHIMRAVNDEVQPWRGTAGRSKFGLRARSTREFKETEEGLATINTVLHAGGGPKSRFLYREALLYYAAALAKRLNFAELFAHIAPYMPDRRRRFALVTRIKRGLLDQSLPGGSGKVQVYFEGAVNILTQVKTAKDLHLLYSGRIMLSELSRVRRIAQMTTITLPQFASDLEVYQRQLRDMAVLNGLIPAAGLTQRPFDQSGSSKRVVSSLPPLIQGQLRTSKNRSAIRGGLQKRTGTQTTTAQHAGSTACLTANIPSPKNPVGQVFARQPAPRRALATKCVSLVFVQS